MKGNGVCWIALACFCLGMGVWKTSGATLGEALNTGGVWQTGGDAPWFAETNASGVVSIRSGDITNGQRSWVEVVIDGPAYVDFDSHGDVGLEVSGSNGDIPGTLLLSQGTMYSGGGINVVSWGGLTVNGDSIVMRGMSVKSLSNVVRWTHFGAGITRLDNLAITPDNNTPCIVTAPTNQSLWLQNNDKGEASFSVVAVGAEPLSYYWFKDKVLLNNDDRISGSRTANLRIINIGFGTGDSGVYSVLVSNVFGSALFGAYTKDGFSHRCGTGATLQVSGTSVLSLPMPFITEQPQNQMVTNGSGVEFSVTAISSNAPPFQYQWYFNETVVQDTTNQVLRLIDVKPSDLGNYWVVVNDGLNSATSAVARLEFRPEFRAGMGKSPTSGRFQFQVSGHPGRTTDILASTNLIDWELLETVTNSTEAQNFTDPAAPLPFRFYRLRQSSGTP